VPNSPGMQQPCFHRLTPLLALLALASACLDPTVRDREFEDCTGRIQPLQVRVVDWYGNPAPNATVVVQKLETGETLTATADAAGVCTAVTEQLGSGTLELSATMGSKLTQPVQVQWTCEACSCRSDPEDVQLKLNR
jgi:hypothetical protein